MNIPTRKTAGKLPSARFVVYDVSNRTDSGWWFAKNSRIKAKTSIPRISAPTPMLLMIDSRRTPAMLMIVVVKRAMSPMNDCMSSDGIGDGSASLIVSG